VPTLEATAMTSVAPSQDFSCEGSNVCDWNLSASMVPDPSNAAVWGVATFVGPAAGTAPHWRTRVFSATP
jgi:hypothetical protein